MRRAMISLARRMELERQARIKESQQASSSANATNQHSSILSNTKQAVYKNKYAKSGVIKLFTGVHFNEFSEDELIALNELKSNGHLYFRNGQPFLSDEAAYYYFIEGKIRVRSGTFNRE